MLRNNSKQSGGIHMVKLEERKGWGGKDIGEKEGIEPRTKE